MKANRITIYILLILSLLACKNKTAQEADGNETSNLITISQEQFKAEGMAIGAASMHCFEDEIACTGFVKASPLGCAKISTPISGIIKSINFSLGDYVKKGQVICELNSNGLIDIQQRFIETKANLKVIKADYDRTTSLFKDKIIAEKEFLKIESEYKTTLGKLKSLTIKLNMLDLDLSKIESGDLYVSLPLKAPINGYLTKQNLTLGQYIEQNQQLIEQINTNQLQLEIAVFEKDVNKLQLGQTVHFNNIGDTETVYEAKLTSIGKGIDMETKSIHCLASIDRKAKSKLIHGSFIQAKIKTNEKNAMALPSDAIIKSGSEYFVLRVNKKDKTSYFFSKEKVTIGSKSKGYTEILENNNLDKVLVKGVYNISTD
ncbi:efflux RND transporter periplasmic adaptor subunit [Ancylomarina sp. 16SWW S1-10-2]|uniref:efflux RND transporter periplasmic adaptor subunit n=1 Tax=Ancylomarina sp. 16SWW S1-10-2 TaxID=2499681 RepID=UPI0012AEAA47|nr:efflux RND transporter periplasmic adaptor subunit [Ancylomarina sp. 16SWW S1-10-2]MRT92793.1 efflux RND transporter periplasmic adaptor subunit [Ancylomarina sp. 16SWW S1-10-2]